MAKKKRGKTKFERMMVSLTVVTAFCVFISVFFFKAQLSSVNIEVERLAREVKNQKETNQSLTMQINELASLENIQEVAKEYGLEYNNDNIKVVMK